MYPGFPGLDWITPYGVMLVMACVSAWWLARRRAAATGIDPSHMDLALPLAFVAGALFAGAMGWFLSSEQRVAGDAYVAEGRLRLYAVVVVVLPVLFACCRFAGLSFRRFADVVAVPALAFMAVIRIGCFLAGCCFGDVSGHADEVARIGDAGLRLQVQTVDWLSRWQVPWAARFPAGSFAQEQHVALGMIEPGAAASLPVHPVQLYETLLVVLLALAITSRRPAFTRPGSQALVALGGYAALEFLLEFLRADNALVLGPLTFNQLVCVAWLAIALLLRGATAAPVKGVVSAPGP
jgi:phosphatidylglycerol:prolipoprotein diacylglycerol transferase